MVQNTHSKSIDFLLENAGPVIQYRLRKDILQDLTPVEEERLLEQIYRLPSFVLLQSYIKPDGYIGSGMHSWDNWRGQVFHETPLQDGESAARLLSYYRIPREHPAVAGFVAAMRNEETLREEFSYIPPEVSRYENRFVGINNGNCLMALIYTMQAMLGYGDDYEDVREFQQICLKGFERVMQAASLEEITKYNPNAKRKYNYPYIEAGEYYPDAYTLAMLAYTKSWRTEQNVRKMTDALNHINTIMRPDNEMHVRICGKYMAPCFALIRPIKVFRPDRIDSITYRRILSEIAMLGVGKGVDVIRESAASVEESLDEDGILRMDFDASHNKRYSPKHIEYPSPYGDVRLEADYRRENALLCDLTFWAVEFLWLVERSSPEPLADS